jgi:hypothetical protein
MIIETYIPGVDEWGSDAPLSFSFGLQNNPVKGIAIFNLSLPQNGQVTLRIYDCSGRLIDKISDHKSIGWYQIPWMAKVNGVYFYTFESQGYRQSGKLVVIR